MNVNGLQLIKVCLVGHGRIVSKCVFVARDAPTATGNQVAVYPRVCAVGGIAPQKVESRVIDFARGRPIQNDLSDLCLRGERGNGHGRADTLGGQYKYCTSQCYAIEEQIPATQLGEHRQFLW